MSDNIFEEYKKGNLPVKSWFSQNFNVDDPFVAFETLASFLADNLQNLIQNNQSQLVSSFFAKGGVTFNPKKAYTTKDILNLTKTWIQKSNEQLCIDLMGWMANQSSLPVTNKAPQTLKTQSPPTGLALWSSNNGSVVEKKPSWLTDRGFQRWCNDPKHSSERYQISISLSRYKAGSAVAWDLDLLNQAYTLYRDGKIRKMFLTSDVIVGFGAKIAILSIVGFGLFALTVSIYPKAAFFPGWAYRQFVPLQKSDLVMSPARLGAEPITNKMTTEQRIKAHLGDYRKVWNKLDYIRRESVVRAVNEAWTNNEQVDSQRIALEVVHGFNRWTEISGLDRHNYDVGAGATVAQNLSNLYPQMQFSVIDHLDVPSIVTNAQLAQTLDPIKFSEAVWQSGFTVISMSEVGPNSNFGAINEYLTEDFMVIAHTEFNTKYLILLHKK